MKEHLNKETLRNAEILLKKKNYFHNIAKLEY